MRYESEDHRRFDQQFAETSYERDQRWRRTKKLPSTTVREQTPEDIYHRALWELERARANFNEALAAYAREYADGEALTAQAIEREGED